MNSQEFVNRREHRRFEVRPECQDRLTATISAHDSGEVLAGIVSDLSLAGTKLLAELPIAVATPVQIVLTSGQDRAVVAGVVRWATRGVQGKWSLGCLFDRNIDTGFFNGLAINGILERRRHPRQQVMVAASARRELGSRDLIPIRIVDYSDGGLCLLSQQGFAPGDRMLIAIATSEQTTSQIVARSEWIEKLQHSHRIGCSFLKPDSCARIRQAVEHGQQPQSRRSASRSLATGVGLGLVCGWSWMVWTDRWDAAVRAAQVQAARLQNVDSSEMLRHAESWLNAHSPFNR